MCVRGCHVCPLPLTHKLRATAHCAEKFRKTDIDKLPMAARAARAGAKPLPTQNQVIMM